MMKKVFCIGLFIIVLCFCGCSNSYLHNSINTNKEIITEKNTDNIVLPNAELSDVNLEKCVIEQPNTDFHILGILGNNYYGYKSKQINEKIEDEYILIDLSSNTQKSLNYQTGTKE